jgi:hypothetical protein
MDSSNKPGSPRYLNPGFSGRYTMPRNPNEAEIVKIAEFRGRIEHLERKIGNDYHSCVNDAERARWAETTRTLGAELVNTVCKRATDEDMDRRERAIDRSTSLIAKVSGTAKPEIDWEKCSIDDLETLARHGKSADVRNTAITKLVVWAKGG